VELGELRPGEVRVLSPAEVEALRKAAKAVIRLGGGRGAGADGKKGGGGRRSIPGREFHALRKQAAKGGRARFAKHQRERDLHVSAKPGESPVGRPRRNRHASERRGPPTGRGPGRGTGRGKGRSGRS